MGVTPGSVFRLRSVRLEPGGAVQDALLREGRLEDLRPDSPGADIEGAGGLLLPGMIDPHVHLRAPGMEAAEDWESGTRAAARGGVTAVLEMPNTRPPTTTPERLAEKRALAVVSRVDWGLHLGATLGADLPLAGAGPIAAVKVYMGSSTGDLLVDQEDALERVFRQAAEAGLSVALHAEDEAIIRERTAALRGDEDVSAHGWVRPPEAAARAVRRALALGERTGAALYFCHVSTGAEIDLLRAAREAGRRVFVEVAPHHLFLSEEDLPRLANFGKVNPPLRSQADQAALWRALADGVVDTIGTDHAPHPREAKERSYRDAPSGMPGLEVALPLLLTAVLDGRLEFGRLLGLTGHGAAGAFGIENRGWVLADLATERALSPGEIQSRCGWSPYVGRPLRGWPICVWVDGCLAYERGEFGPPGLGREMDFRHGR